MNSEKLYFPKVDTFSREDRPGSFPSSHDRKSRHLGALKKKKKHVKVSLYGGEMGGAGGGVGVHRHGGRRKCDQGLKGR